MDDQRETEPGFVLRAYERAKTKLAALKNRGEAKADALLSGDTREPVNEAEHAWKDKPTEETSEADDVRSQEEMKETFGQNEGDRGEGGKAEAGDDRTREARTDLPDGTASMTYEDAAAAAEAGPRDADARAEADRKVEIESPALRTEQRLRADDNPAAPAMSALDQEAIAKLAEAEDGRIPTDGLGLDDGPGVSYPGDVGR